MKRLLRALGWSLATLGVIFAVLSVLVAFDPKEKETDALLGMIMFAMFAGLPGGLLLWRDRQATRADELETQFAGFLRTHDQFTAAEMAEKIGKTELETEQMIIRAAARHQLDLVFHRPDRTYLHRNRIKKQYRVIERCGSCGAALGQEIAMEDEALACPYCGSAVA